MIAGLAAALVALASPVVDRTYTCTMTGTGSPDPYRALDVDASGKVGQDSPVVNLLNGVDFSGREKLRAGFATGPYGSGQNRTGELWLSRAPCTASMRRVALTSTGLRGGRLNGLRESYACEVPGRVLLRIRAVFMRPVSLRVDRGFWVAHGNMKTAAVAVTTLDRRPILLVSADRERARLFASRARCTQE